MFKKKNKPTAVKMFVHLDFQLEVQLADSATPIAPGNSGGLKS